MTYSLDLCHPLLSGPVTEPRQARPVAVALVPIRKMPFLLAYLSFCDLQGWLIEHDV